MDFLNSTQTEYHDETFKNIKESNLKLHKKVFYDCIFTGCHLTDTAFVDCKFVDTQFRNSDLSLMNVLGSSFTKVTFEECKMLGVNWAEANWTSPLHSIAFIGCNVSHSTFFGLTFKKLVLTKCTAENVDFGEANLVEANFTHSNLAESRFLHTNLTQADFSYATNYSINANLNTLKKTKFTLPEAMALLYGLDIVLMEDGKPVKR